MRYLAVTKMLAWFNNIPGHMKRIANVTAFAWGVFAITGIILAIFGDSMIVLFAAASGLSAVIGTIALACIYLEEGAELCLGTW